MLLRRLLLLSSAVVLAALAAVPSALAADCGSSSTPPGQSPAAAGQLCGVDISPTSSVEFSGTIATYSVSGAATLDTATVDWGDGSSSGATRVGPNANGSGTFTAAHTYAKAGSFTVTVTSTGTYNNGPIVGNTGHGSATVLAPDTDGDGVRDNADNCAAKANPDQANADKDTFGDACDDDFDNDGRANAADACPQLASGSADGCPNVNPAVTAPFAQSVGRSSVITVRATCTGACAKLGAAGTARSGALTVALAPATASSRPGQIALKLRLPSARLKALRAALRRGSRATATITVTAYSSSGRALGRRTVRMTLRR